MSETADRAAEAQKGHIGWVEFIHPKGATTHVAYIHEDGSVYLPEGDAVDPEWFTLAAASDRFWPLVQRDERDATQRRAGAVEALRGAADHMAEDPALVDVVTWLRERADRIEAKS